MAATTTTSTTTSDNVNLSGRPYRMHPNYSLDWFFSMVWFKNRVGTARNMLEKDDDPMIVTDKVSVNSTLTRYQYDDSTLSTDGVSIISDPAYNNAGGRNSKPCIFRGTFGNNMDDDDDNDDDNRDVNFNESKANVGRSIFTGDFISDTDSSVES
jgi:hypothetical protein